MTMMMARICLHEDVAEDGIAILKRHGFTVLTHVFPDEPDYVFVEASRDEASRMLDELNDILPTPSNISEAGSVPAGHKPFQYEGPPWK